MSDNLTRVWVKTSLLDEVVYGKAQSSSKRKAAFEEEEDEEGIRNWGWALGELLSDDVLKDDGLTSTAPLKIYIRDEESNHNRSSVEVPAKSVADGKVVMANDHDDFEDDPEEEPTGTYPEDLITLTHLHEPAVVYCLRKRYMLDKIYTATGPILLALNPFKRCNALYSNALMKKYWIRGEASMMMGGTGSGKEDEKKSESMDDEEEPLQPHVYGIADSSYRAMMTHLEQAMNDSAPRRRGAPGAAVNTGAQSILVSGESGAGKTVTTKFIMQYLATLSQNENIKQSQRQMTEKKGNATKSRVRFAPKGKENDPTPPVDDKKSVEQQVLQSNPILESFGNARTIRNDNSSRFGKFIEIQFTSSGNLSGASVETYLLEKVRLATQMPGERNYHIFYEILTGFSDEERDEFFLYDFTPEDFNMTNSSGTYDRRDGVDDYDTYSDLRNAMDVMGFAEEEQKNILSVTSACLHFSNVEVEALSADESKLVEDGTHLEAIISLLGTTFDELNRAICYFSIQAGKERHVRSLGQAKSQRAVVGLFKAIYGAMFTFIVKRVNSSITVPTGGGRMGAKTASFIGVLDIFGFESFKHNSFEQLCINFCNEALQRQFNLFVLKNEQDEYEREGIQWSFISFPDNNEVLELIDKKGSGILKILDDQCRAPGCTDKSFAQIMYQKCTGHPRFQADFRQVGALKFGVVHYAGPVEYDTGGFVDKNKDELPREATELLQSCQNDFVKELAKILSGDSGDEKPKEDPAASPGASRSARGVRARPAPRGRAALGRSGGGSTKKSSRHTVGLQFSTQLQSLLSKIDSTSPHYVRCLKPNDKLIPDNFDPVIIADQLRCAGVVEAVRVSRLGYPQRYNHTTFVHRYSVLALKEIKKATKLSRKSKPVDVLVQAIALKIVELDTSKGVNKEEDNSKKKGSKSSAPAPTVDLVAVGIQVGKTKVFLRRKAYDIIERLRKRKMAEAAVAIQKTGRRYIAITAYKTMKSGFIKLQALTRGLIAMEETMELRRNQRATTVQTSFRRYIARKRYLGIMYIARWSQRIYRGKLGRRKYHALNQIRKAIVIQKYYRCCLYRKRYVRKQKAVLTLQCAIRSYFARKELKELKAAAKDLANMANEKEKLQKEKQDLLLKLERMKAAKLEAEKAAKAAKEMSSTDMEELKNLKIEVKQLKADLVDKQTKLQEETQRADNAKEQVNETELKMTELKETSEKLQEKLDLVNETVANKESEVTTLQGQIHDLHKQVSASSSLDDSLKRLQAENEKLKEDLEAAQEEVQNAEPAGETVDIEEYEDLKHENDQLIQQIEDMKQEAFFGANETVQKLESALEEIEGLKAELAETKQQAENATASVNLSAAISPQDSAVSVVNSAELDKAQREIASLKLELEYVKAKNKERENSFGHESSNFDLNQSLSNMPPKDLSATSAVIGTEYEDLRYEVLRLEKELDDAHNELDKLRNAEKNLKKEQSINSRYEELARLASACMDKDREIQTLRQTIEQLREELDAAKKANANNRNNNNNNNNNDSFLDDSLSDLDDNEPSFWTSIFHKKGESHGTDHLKKSDRSSRNKANRTGSELLTVEDASALKGVNEMLRRELESACTELNETKRKLAEEMERSAQDMEAFAEALRGVDELRTAAEMMSRELTRIKKKKRWASYRNLNNSEMDLVDDDDQSVISMATTQLEDAKRTISRHNPSQREIHNPIWGKIDMQQGNNMDSIDEVPQVAVFGNSGRSNRRKKENIVAIPEDFRLSGDN